MNFDELTINGNKKDDNCSASTTTAANPEIETFFSETPCQSFIFMQCKPTSF